MDLSKSQKLIIQGLKSRGPQSVKILAKQLDMTSMGARQHLLDLEKKGYIKQTQEEKQTRGRPVHLWKLSDRGHKQFPDSHSQVTVELIDVIRDSLGDAELTQIVEQRSARQQTSYQAELDDCGDEIPQKIAKLAELRSQEGFMAEVRLLPNSWLLIENHCPICSAAKSCAAFCDAELTMFQQLLANLATVERSDHLLSGARRCAYKISPLGA